MNDHFTLIDRAVQQRFALFSRRAVDGFNGRGWDRAVGQGHHTKASDAAAGGLERDSMDRWAGAERDARRDPKVFTAPVVFCARADTEHGSRKKL